MAAPDDEGGERRSASTGPAPLHVLVVEDSEVDASLMLRQLRSLGRPVAFERVETAEAMERALAKPCDVVLCDWSMPSFSAMRALDVMKKSGLDLPFIVVSGTVGEESAVDAMKAGAHDYVLKDRLTRLSPAVERELRECASRAAGRQAEVAAKRSDERYRALFEHAPQPTWVVDSVTHRFLAVNAAAMAQYGYDAAEFAVLSDDALLVPDAGDLPAVRAGTGRVVRHRKKAGTVCDVELHECDIEFEGHPARLVSAPDVTLQRRLEAQLRQSQKMDAVGKLAGGIAHDFNNILSVVLGYSEALLAELRPGEPMHPDIDEIRKAAVRAAALTRQLLMFSRQQVLAPRVLDLNDVLTSMDTMLQRILGADIDLVSRPSRPLGKVRVDPSSIEQVVLNLVVNARDAMPSGGRLSMETADVFLDEAYGTAHLGVAPGPYVMLAVTDTGCGIDQVTRERIFEPFYTTKGPGEGTGLGLSTVLGIVQQSGGSIWVYSEIGKGTTFKVYLPRVDGDIEGMRTAAASRAVGGSETILLAEDDDQVRAVARSILQKSGYFVIEARNAGEALLQSETHTGTIHLLLSDVVMPRMSGPDLAARLAISRPGMKVLCMSGYTDDSVIRHGVLAHRVAFLQKPITPEALALKVREVLDGPAKT